MQIEITSVHNTCTTVDRSLIELEARRVDGENAAMVTIHMSAFPTVSRDPGPDSRSETFTFLPPINTLPCYNLSGQLNLRLTLGPKASLLCQRHAHKRPAIRKG